MRLGLTALVTAAATPAIEAGATGTSAVPDVQTLAKSFLRNGSGYWSKAQPSLFSDDFVFRGPLVGPLNKSDFLANMATLAVYESFPDITPNAFGFAVDPSNPLRVWFWVRTTATFTEPWPAAGQGPSSPLQPTGLKIRLPTESVSILFSPTGQVRQLSPGFVANKFEGNTQGEVAILGLFLAVGAKPPQLKMQSDAGSIPSWYSE